jgi:hypothetical protein
MVQPPKSLGLFLCDQVIFERDTLKPSLIGCFGGVAVNEFPSAPQRFDVFAAITDGMGAVTIDLTATHLGTDDEVYRRSLAIRFPDPLRVVHFRYRVLDCEFPVAGVYLVALSVAEVEIVACRVRVYQRGSP